jgi:hypothetical protein
MVPRMLSPSHRCTSIEQKWDETKINQHLLESLNAFIAGTDDYQDIYQVIHFSLLTFNQYEASEVQLYILYHFDSI